MTKEPFALLLGRAGTAASMLNDIAEREIREARTGEEPFKGGPTRRELLAEINETLTKIAEAHYHAKGT